ncbi:hypothetical protein DT076_16565 [Desertihabitans brevis]|uniref:Gp28/Gp37-like domain-containing protein n=1 Tax=Desertihabitans brevis TaxID=2268447 RepID=A0A367YTF4_9ACTN|nr:hypothetical protein [Desertihabitans brevis]RCK68261.1 hypothetical protein DT076_16565 [Desertihabitans brevis]
MGPFKITLFDKTFQRLGWLSDPIEVRCTPRHNRIAECSITVPVDHRQRNLLQAPGARITVDHRGEQQFSGTWDGLAAQGPTLDGTTTLTYTGDLALIYDMLGYPRPGFPVGQQTVESDNRTGPTETVVKAVISANKGRWGAVGDRIMVAPDSGRGAASRVRLRMVPLSDQLEQILDRGGIGLTVQQIDGQLVVDCYEPATFPIALREESGALLDWQWSRSAPTVTRVVVGGAGEGTARIFRNRVDTAREAEWGFVREHFVDARDVGADDPDMETLLSERMDEALAEGAPTAGLGVTLQDTGAFSYGENVHVGDRVTLRFGSGLEVTDILREATLVWSRDTGPAVEATPVIGERTDDPDLTLIRTVAALARGDRARRTR